MIPFLTAAAAIWLAWLIGRGVSARPESLTVEAQQAHDRAIVVSLPQHTGSSAHTVGHDYSYGADDMNDITPESITDYMARVRESRQSR